jgi:hypothetical protein
MIKMSKITSLLAAITLVCMVALIAAHHPVLADSKSQVQSGINTAAGGQGQAPPDQSLNSTIRTGLNLFSAIAGVAAVIMLIVGGFRYIVSAGNDTAVSDSKKTILYALIGLVIVSLAQVIVKFVLQNVGT